MKVVLINPPDISVVKETPLQRGIRFGVPLGIAYIAAVLEQADFEVQIIDCPGMTSERTFGWNEICETLGRSLPDVIGITTTTPTLISAIELAKKSKELFPKVPVILGGHGTFTIEEEILARVKEVDAITCGEGEETILELLRTYENASSLSNVKGIAFKHEKEIIKTPPRAFIQNLDAIPFPARHLLPMRSYISPLGSEKRKGTTLITSRGCPFSCVFCASSMFWGHKFRARSAINVVTEMEQLYSEYSKYGLNSLYFGDDNFTADKEKVLRICDLINERGLNHLGWSCQARIDCADEELFQKMYQAGCFELEFGVESGNEEILRRIRKGITTGMVRNAVRIAKKVGLKVHGSFIIGLPGDTPETIEQTIKFSEEVGFDSTGFAPALVYPSTELAKHKNIDWLNFLVKEELTNPVTFYGLHHYFHPCVPTYADRDEMKAVMKKIAIRKLFKYALRMQWLAHPATTLHRINQHRRTYHVKSDH